MMICNHKGFVFLVVTCTFYSTIHTSRIEVDANGNSIRLNHFWESTGLCPLDPKTEAYKFLLLQDEKLNIAYIGALPNRSIKQIRIHWLLNMIFVRVINGEYTYNFTYLDTLLDWIHDQKLFVGFELMGIPQLDDKSRLLENKIYFYEFWYNITFEIASRYIAKYGFNYMKQWRFETWNEPDLKSYNTLNFTLRDYLSYTQACAHALNDVSNNMNGNLKFGGPAGLFKDPKKHPLCWGLLKACNKKNKIKQRSCPLQYISFHKKGDETANGVLSNTVKLLNEVYLKFPKIRKIPIANDEADILTNWSKSEDWRGDTRYAAMMAKVIIDYFKILIVDMKIPFELLSFDNAFLNYNPYFFTQRTLLTRFQINNTNPSHIQFIKKPAYSVMGLLSLLGDEYLKEDVMSSDPFVDFLSTRSVKNKNESQMMSLLITYVNDTKQDKQNTKRINVVFNNLPMPDSKYVIYLLDNVVTNPFLLWKTYGSPVFPTKSLQRKMRDCEEPRRLEGPSSILNLSLILQLNLTLPSVAIINICSRTSQPPGRVTHLTAHNITRNEVLLIWKDSKVRTKCLRTYEVEYHHALGNNSYTQSGFRRLNYGDTIFLSYHHAAIADRTVEATRGWYRVRAVDYWNKPGKYSKVLQYTSN